MSNFIKQFTHPELMSEKVRIATIASVLTAMTCLLMTFCCVIFILLTPTEEIPTITSTPITATETATYSYPNPESTFTPSTTLSSTPTDSPTPIPTNTPLPPPPTDPPTDPPTPFPAIVPIQPQHPEGATALCKDGTYSYSKKRSGTCSHHEGVDKWLK